jgi:hypothetical protein
MLISMRTTLIIDDVLLREARIRAAEQDLTLSDVVNAALRDALRQSQPAHPPFTMITYGPSKAAISHEPGDFAEIEESDVRSSLGR